MFELCSAVIPTPGNTACCYRFIRINKTNIYLYLTVKSKCKEPKQLSLKLTRKYLGPYFGAWCMIMLISSCKNLY